MMSTIIKDMVLRLEKGMSLNQGYSTQYIYADLSLLLYLVVNADIF